MTDDLKIVSEIDSRKPRVCRFTSARTLYVGTKTICSTEDTKGLPLAEELIGLSGIEKIQLIGHLLIVTRTEQREWKELDHEIKTVLTAYLVSAQALTPDDVNEKMMLMGRSTREKIQYLIDSQINPGVAEQRASRGGTGSTPYQSRQEQN